MLLSKYLQVSVLESSAPPVGGQPHILLHTTGKKQLPASSTLQTHISVVRPLVNEWVGNEELVKMNQERRQKQPQRILFQAVSAN